ncbi:hypothetical protein N9C84_02805 [Desulfobacterales bacterium]|nr:hypothetical protein [Desulfobacterales bacterium]
MIVGIHPDKKHAKLGSVSKRYKKILDINNIRNIVLYIGDDFFWDKVKKCDLFIFQWNQYDYLRQIAQNILPIIESHLEIQCFPKLLSSWIYDDKIREYYLLKQFNLPIAESWIFYDPSSAIRFSEKAHYPLVYKLRSGAGSQMVKLIKTKIGAKKQIDIMFRKGVDYQHGLPGTNYDYIVEKGLLKLVRKKLGKIKQRLKDGTSYYSRNWFVHKNYILFQKFLPNNLYDTRVVVIGKQAFAFQRMNREMDFRASGSTNHIYEPEKIDLRFIDIAFKVSNMFGFDVMSYDFLYDEHNQPAITELSYVFGSKEGSKVSECPGYWDDKMNWYEGKTDVSYCILSNLLDIHNLKKLK